MSFFGEVCGPFGDGLRPIRAKVAIVAALSNPCDEDINDVIVLGYTLERNLSAIPRVLVVTYAIIATHRISEIANFWNVVPA